MESFLEFDGRRLAWGLLGLGLLAVLAMIVLPFVGTFAAAIFLYYAIRPVYARVNDRVSRPNVAATVTLLVVALPVVVVVGYAAAVGLQNLDQLLQSADLEQYRSLLEPYLEQPQGLLSKLRQQSGGSAQGTLSAVTSAVGTFFGVLLRLFLVFAFTFYFLRDDHKLSGWVRDQFSPGVGPGADDRHVFQSFLDRVDDDLQSVYVGNLLNVVAISVLAVLTNLGINVVAPASSDIPYPILVGLLTGIGSLVPAVGMKIVYFPIAGVLFATAVAGGGAVWVPVVYFLVSLAIVDTIPDFVVRAYLSGGNLHMGLVMFSYILGSVVFGWYGIFLGPLLLVVIYHFGDVALPYVLGNDIGA